MEGVFYKILKMAIPPHHHFKNLLLLGDSGVGKTSLLLRFSDIPIGIDLSVKTIEIGDEWVNLQVCDTASPQRLIKKIRRTRYQAADGVLLVYDVTNELSFKHVKDWIRESKSNNVKTILVGNKADMDGDESKRAVSRCRGQALADVCGFMFLETSAKTNKNVEDVFVALASSN